MDFPEQLSSMMTSLSSLLTQQVQLVHSFRSLSNKGRSTLVPIVPKITARWRQMDSFLFSVQNLVKMKGVLHYVA